MPKFKNTSKNPLNIITNGRKIVVPPNGEIEGPKEFSVYKALTIVSDTKKPNKYVNTNKLSSINKNLILNDNDSRSHVKNLPTTTRAAKPNHNNNSSMIPIPNIFPIDDEFNKNLEIENTLNHLNNYPKSLPSVGICILTKNSYELIKDCCDSIIQHVKYPATKIYIFDTGTTDTKVLDYYESIKKVSQFPIEFLSLGAYQLTS